MAEQLAARHGIPACFDSLSSLLERARPDVVHITTPPSSHTSLVHQAVAAGCHVFVEKPVALDEKQTRQIVELAGTANRKLAAGYIYQFDPAAERARRLIAGGAIGDPVHVESFYGYNLSGPYGAVLLRDSGHWVHRLPGKLLHNVIDHLIIKVVEYLPDQQPSIQVSGSLHRHEGPPFHDELRVMFQGAQVSAYATFSSRIRPDTQWMKVYGTRNSLSVNFASQTVVLDDAPRLPGVIGRLIPPFQQAWQHAHAGLGNLSSFARSNFHYFAGLRRLLQLFYDAIRDGRPSPTPPDDLIRTARFMESIFRQLNGSA